MNKVISILQHASNGKVVLILFILTNLVYGLILGYSILPTQKVLLWNVEQ